MDNTILSSAPPGPDSSWCKSIVGPVSALVRYLGPRKWTTTVLIMNTTSILINNSNVFNDMKKILKWNFFYWFTFILLQIVHPILIPAGKAKSCSTFLADKLLLNLKN